MTPKTAKAYLTGVKVATQQLSSESNMWILILIGIQI